ncbi:MAG: hypothetical protein Q9164_005578 [Protoblastenia rupestris]
MAASATARPRRGRKTNNASFDHAGPAAVLTPPVTEDTSKTKSSNAYDANFMLRLAQNRVLGPKRNRLPANFDQIKKRQARRRASLSPSRYSINDFKDFVNQIIAAHKEEEVMQHVVPRIKGDKAYPSIQNQQCRKWKPLGDADLVFPKPDYYEGILQCYENKSICQSLDEWIIPADCLEAPFIPNFFLEAKAPRGSPDIVRNQACYHGAFGARAIHKLRNYGIEETYDEKSYTFSATYAGGMLTTYAHFLSKPENKHNPPHYHMATLGGWALFNSLDTFRQGATALRNLRDLAHELRVKFVEAANKKLRKAGERSPESCSSRRRPKGVCKTRADATQPKPLLDVDIEDSDDGVQTVKRRGRPSPLTKSAKVTKPKAKTAARAKLSRKIRSTSSAKSLWVALKVPKLRLFLQKHSMDKR